MSITVKDASGVTQTVETPSAVGQAAMAASKPVVIASNQSAVPVSGTVAASQSGTWNIGAITTLPAVVVSGTVTANVGTGTQPVSGTVAATQSGTWNVGSITTLPVQFGAGASTSTTQRVTIDTGQVGSLVAGGVPCVSGGTEWETVAASQTDQSLGATGATGDYLESLLCVVATAATSQVQIKDGSGSAITVLPNAVGAGVGTYPIPIGLVSLAGAWKVTTAAGVSVIATGNFT